MAVEKSFRSTSHRCARCNKKLSRWIYSKFTKKRYCIDIDACKKRARRKQLEAL